MNKLMNEYSVWSQTARGRTFQLAVDLSLLALLLDNLIRAYV